jgi:translocator protein
VSSNLALVGFVGLCLLVGAVGGSIATQSAHRWYLILTKPPGTPPDGLFAPIWLVLYVMMGTAAWQIWKRHGASRPLRIWGWQLAANALWAPSFFGLHSPPLAMLVMAGMLILIALTIRAFLPIHRLAGWLMVPYLGWCLFAAYLNAAFWLLNPG